MFVNLVALSLLVTPPPPELANYLKKPDASYQFKVLPASDGIENIEMTSQVWQGITWKNQILFRQPTHLRAKNLAILFITGDGPRPGDYQNLELMAEAAGMPVAMLFNIPNQPIYGKKEDGLIAYTFEKYLETKDASWPLLFPMTKSALRAMDAVQTLRAKSDNPIKHFVVTGASKRGWTTWMTAAAGDKRVKAIAPMVYDNLNIRPQMKHQIESWGAYSEQIVDYTKLGLQEKMGTAQGQRLSLIVDPYSYRANFKVPILVVKGSNDPYWTADAADFYYQDLKPAHWMLAVPNAGHGLNGGFMAVQTVGAFSRAMAGEFKMPNMSERTTIVPSGEGQSVTIQLSHRPAAVKLIPWLALSETTDFRPQKFVSAPGAIITKDSVTFRVPSGKKAALFLEAVFKTPTGNQFSLSTPTKVLR